MNRVMIFTPVFKSIFVETWSDTAKMVSGLLEEQKTCLHINERFPGSSSFCRKYGF